MSAPDRVIFGPGEAGAVAHVTWGDLRRNLDEQFRLQCLDRRLRSFLHGQVAELPRKEVNAPFLSSTVALVGIGSLGEIFYRDAIAAADTKHGQIMFCKACDRLDPKFTRTPPKVFKDAFVSRWNADRPRSVSEILYIYFRNSLVHGYYGEAVFLTGDETADVRLEDEGYVFLNPDWFLDRFLRAIEWHCNEMLVEKANGALRYNALNYIRRLIGEPPLPDRRIWVPR